MTYDTLSQTNMLNIKSAADMGFRRNKDAKIFLLNFANHGIKYAPGLFHRFMVAMYRHQGIFFAGLLGPGEKKPGRALSIATL